MCIRDRDDEVVVTGQQRRARVGLGEFGICGIDYHQRFPDESPRKAFNRVVADRLASGIARIADEDQRGTFADRRVRHRVKIATPALQRIARRHFDHACAMQLRAYRIHCLLYTSRCV